MKKLLYISIPLLLVALVMLYFQVVRGASEAQFPEGSSQNTGFGTTEWLNSSNITASDNAYAANTGDGAYSYYLLGYNYGFSIPTGATIDGIVVEIERYTAFGNSTSFKDARVRIYRESVIGTTDKANTVDYWPTTEASATYGSSSDLWGETWTAANINATGFGVALSVECGAVDDFCGSFGYEARVDSMQITVYYTEASASTETTTFQIRNGSIRQVGGSVKIGK